jgi:uncharacterized protein (TIGR00730 family)
MRKISALCVFCGSRVGSRPVYGAAAMELGSLLAKKKIQLVYGGGNVGLMGKVADSCMAAGGEVIGIIPTALFEKEHGHRGLSRLEVVSTMHERKARMAALADGFIALPGGIGTFEELLEALTWSQLGIHAKPVALVNVSGYFDPLLALLDSAVGQGFLGEEQRSLLLVADHVQGIIDQMLELEFHPNISPTNMGI